MGDETAASRSAPEAERVRVVVDRHLDVVRDTPLARALSAALATGNNLLRSVFLNPESQDTLPRWGASADHLTALLRRNLEAFGQDERYDELVGELGACSQGFRERWATPDADAAGPSASTMELFHPMTGTQSFVLACTVLAEGSVQVDLVPAGPRSRSALRTLAERSGTTTVYRVDSAR